MAIHTMHLLYPRFKDALNILMTLRDHTRRKNVIWGSSIAMIAGVLALFAASFFIGPVAAVGATAYAAGIGGTASAVVSAGSTYVAIDNFFEGAVLEQSEYLIESFVSSSWH